MKEADKSYAGHHFQIALGGSSTFRSLFCLLRKMSDNAFPVCEESFYGMLFTRYPTEIFQFCYLLQLFSQAEIFSSMLKTSQAPWGV